MNRTEALQLLTILTSSTSSQEEKHRAALQLKEFICILLPEEEND